MADTQSRISPPIKFTRFASRAGRLTKELSLNAAGILQKNSAPVFSRGAFETLTVDTSTPGIAGRVIDALSGWTTMQALSSSLSLGDDSGKVVVKEALDQSPGAVARTAAHFGFKPDVCGVLILDYDPPKDGEALSPGELGVILSHVWPALADGVALHWSSTGSMVYHPDGRELVGMTGQRVFVVIASNADVPRVVRVLNDRCTLAGYGRAKVNKIGAVSFAPLFDPAMQEVARLDFSPAGCVLRDGLTQRRGLPTILADGEVLDSIQTLPDLTSAEAAEVQAIIAEAKAKAQPEAERLKAAYLAEREESAAVKAAKAGEDVEQARHRARVEVAALQQGVLPGSAELIHVDDDGAEHVVTVDALLRDRKDWHGKKFLSPGNPDHRGRSPDAIAYLAQAQGVLYDLDGPVSYRLESQAVRLAVTSGTRAMLADQIATQLAARVDVFNLGGRAVQFADGSPRAMTLARAMFLTGLTCSLYRQNKDGKSTSVDVDQQTAQMVVALLPERCRKILGRSAIPVITTEGRIVQSPGHDEDTGLYLDIGPEFLPAPINPTREQVVAALRRLWRPWCAYEWTTPHDRAVMLATVLTTVLRPTIQAAPGAFVDAASAGSGKTNASLAILNIVQGHEAGATMWPDNEAEQAKQLLAMVIDGRAVVLYDNVRGTVKSQSVEGAVTNGAFSARELGQSANAGGVFRPIWLMSGNQASLSHDMGSRFMQARIDCPDGQPHLRSFDFSPPQVALADRAGIVQATLTVHRGWHAAGRPQVDGISTRFTAWGRTVRQMVLWLHQQGLDTEAGIGELGDPCDSLLRRATASDPESAASEELFGALADAFPLGEPFGAADVLITAQAGRENLAGEAGALFMALEGMVNNKLNKNAVASVLRFRRDRVHVGLRLRELPKGVGRAAARAGVQYALTPA